MQSIFELFTQLKSIFPSIHRLKGEEQYKALPPTLRLYSQGPKSIRWTPAFALPMIFDFKTHLGWSMRGTNCRICGVSRTYATKKGMRQSQPRAFTLCAPMRTLSSYPYLTRPLQRTLCSSMGEMNYIEGSDGISAFEGPGNSTVVEESEYGKFVRFLHLASPYVVGHRGRKFVILIPGEVMQDRSRLGPILEDILLLHGLGVRLVLVVGCKEIIDADLSRLQTENFTESAVPGKVIAGYRVSDAETMKSVIFTAGTLVNLVSAMLSKGPPIPMMRRHAKGGQSSGSMRLSPSVQVVSGNYVTAKRRGIVGGVDFGHAGIVSNVHAEAVSNQLQDGTIVVLSCMGISSAGELLNCSCYDVAVQTSLALMADKFICFTGKEVRMLGLPQYLPLEEAKIQAGNKSLGKSQWSYTSNMDVKQERDIIGEVERIIGLKDGLDLGAWHNMDGVPFDVIAAITACHHGVTRSHLIDCEQDGALLLELYSRDGIAGVCMVAADIYQGIRSMEYGDIIPVSLLLRQFRREGHRLPFEIDAIADKLDQITVLERDGQVLACAVTEILNESFHDGKVAELSVIIVNPSHRGNGFGDSLLDFVEQDLRRRGVKILLLIADCGSFDWFVERGFRLEGEACMSDMIPLDTREQVPKVAKLYLKPIVKIDSSLDVPAGKRIGF